MNHYIQAINETNDVDTLKAIWWTIGMDTNLDGEDILIILEQVMERYNLIK